MNIQWLKLLQADIWTIPPASPHSLYNIPYESRRLSQAEWDQVTAILQAHHLPCSMNNACMGFGCSIVLYEEPLNHYPGVEMRPTSILEITKDHLPIPVRDKDSKQSPDRTTFEDGWEAFSPYTHSEANKALLALYKMEAPKSKGYYDH